VLSRLILCAVAPLLLWAATPARGAASWSYQPVAGSGTSGGFTSVALDGSGRVHMSYYDGSTHDLKYAVRQSGLWTTTVIDTTGDTGLWTSIALDAQGNPHISYYYALLPDLVNPVGNLKYATKTGGAWTVQTVDATLNVGEYTSIAIDSQGRPHITYYDNGHGDLKHAVKTSGVWSLETVDATGNVGAYTSLHIDALDHLHVAYKDVGGVALKYAVKIGSTWTKEVAVPLAGAVYNSIGLDSQGKPHVVYYDENITKVYYANKVGASWTSDIARALGEDLSGPFTSLAIDSQDVLHMAYFNNVSGFLSYGSLVGGFWQMQDLDRVGWYIGLALDGQGNPHISYQDVYASKVEQAVLSGAVSDANVGGRSRIVAMTVFPNPVRTATTVVLRTPTALPISLVVLDARGRLVRSIAARELPPGTHEFAWDGRDDAGSPVGAGIYFAVVKPEELATSQKLVVIR
jgi:flagellar hook assembly protein FlgD